MGWIMLCWIFRLLFGKGFPIQPTSEQLLFLAEGLLQQVSCFSFSSPRPVPTSGVPSRSPGVRGVGLRLPAGRPRRGLPLPARALSLRRARAPRVQGSGGLLAGTRFFFSPHFFFNTTNKRIGGLVVSFFSALVAKEGLPISPLQEPGFKCEFNSPIQTTN